jgi:hypothetical protein
VISQNIVHYGLRRVLRLLCSSLDAMASRVWEHAPGGTEAVEPVLMPRPLERVVSGPTTWGMPITREAGVGDALCCERNVPPTTLDEIRDTLVSHGSVYARGHRYALTFESTRKAFPSAARRVSRSRSGELSI